MATRIDYESVLREIISERFNDFWDPPPDKPLSELFEGQLDADFFFKRDRIAGILINSLSKSLEKMIEESFSNFYSYKEKLGENVEGNISLLASLAKLFHKKLKHQVAIEESFVKNKEDLEKRFKEIGSELYSLCESSYRDLIERLGERSKKLRGYLCLYVTLRELKAEWGNLMRFEKRFIGDEKPIQEVFCDLVGNNISFSPLIEDFNPFELPDIPSVDKQFWPLFIEKYSKETESGLQILLKRVCSFPRLRDKGDILYEYLSQFFEIITKLKDNGFLSSDFLGELFDQLVVQHGILEYEAFYKFVEAKYYCVPKVSFLEDSSTPFLVKSGELDVLLLKDNVYLGIEITTRNKLNAEKNEALTKINELMQRKNLKFEMKIVKNKEELEKVTLI